MAQSQWLRRYHAELYSGGGLGGTVIPKQPLLGDWLGIDRWGEMLSHGHLVGGSGFVFPLVSLLLKTFSIQTRVGVLTFSKSPSVPEEGGVSESHGGRFHI